MVAGTDETRTVIGPGSRFTLGALLTMAALIIALATGYSTLLSRANAALPREEAYKSFVTTETFRTDVDKRDAANARIERKLDRLTELLMQHEAETARGERSR